VYVLEILILGYGLFVRYMINGKCCTNLQKTSKPT